MENKNIAIGIITFTLLLSLGFNLKPEDTHYCLDRNITSHCDGFSKYYGLLNGKCINELGPNKLCRSGWGEIFEEKLINKEDLIINSKSKYICNQVNCSKI